MESLVGGSTISAAGRLTSRPSSFPVFPRRLPSSCSICRVASRFLHTVPVSRCLTGNTAAPQWTRYVSCLHRPPSRRVDLCFRIVLFLVSFHTAHEELGSNNCWLLSKIMLLQHPASVRHLLKIICAISTSWFWVLPSLHTKVRWNIGSYHGLVYVGSLFYC